MQKICIISTSTWTTFTKLFDLVENFSRLFFLLRWNEEQSILLDCRRLPPVAACSIPLTIMDKTRAHRDMLCPDLKTKLIKLPLNNLLDKSPPSMIYIYLHINIYIYDPTNIYVLICKIHTNSKEARIMRERF